MGLEVEIERDVCMGSGNCLYAAPGVFDLDDDSIAFVVDRGAAPEEVIVAAATGCPTRAIAVRRDGSPLV